MAAAMPVQSLLAAWQSDGCHGTRALVAWLRAQRPAGPGAGALSLLRSVNVCISCGCGGFHRFSGAVLGFWRGRGEDFVATSQYPFCHRVARFIRGTDGAAQLAAS